MANRSLLANPPLQSPTFFTLASRSLARVTARMPAWLLWIAAPAACAWIGAYILLRSVQPFPLDAFEEYELHKAVRWWQGASLYAPPGVEVLPEAYPPLYFWVVGLWTAWAGESFVALRLVSLAALIASLAVGYFAVAPAGDRSVARLAFLTVLVGFHALAGKWFEVGKPDMLMTLFVAIAVATGEHRTWREVIWSSLAVGLACLTKQNAVLFVFPLCVAHAAAGRWRWAAAWGVGMGVVVGTSYLLLDHAFAGQFFHYVFDWPAAHGLNLRAGAVRALEAAVARGPLLFAVVAGALVFAPRDRWTWSLLTALALAVMGMSKFGGIANHLLPVAYVASVVAGRGAATAWAGGITVRRWALVAALAACVLPGLPRRTDFRWLGKRADEVDAWVQAVRRLNGPVAVSHHVLMARRAGAESFFSDSIFEFPGVAVPADVRREIASQRFRCLILKEDPELSPTPGWSRLIAAYYEPAGELDFPNRSRTLPCRLYVARGTPEPTSTR